jgi:glycosyltransferase involved in cell wall biosynthesis
MYKNKKIGVVVPAFNEAKLIAKVIAGIPQYVDRVYIIDDCSEDNTREISTNLVAGSDGRVRVICHGQNGGVGMAIATGYQAGMADEMDVIAVMAGDNQMDPMQLPRLLDPIVEGKADYTVGDRISNLGDMKGMSILRRFGNFTLKWLTRVSAWNYRISDPQNGYTALSSSALSRLNLENIYPRYGYCNDILVKLSAVGARIQQVSMPAVYGEEKSKIRYQKYIPTVSWLLFRRFFWRIGYAFRRKKRVC